MSVDDFGGQKWRTTGIHREEAWDAAEHRSTQGLSPPHRKNDLVQNVNSTKVENPGFY